MTNKISVVYHGNCPDGICAGYSAYLKFGESADYYEWKYNRNEWNFPKGNTIYFLDCSPLRTEYYDELIQNENEVHIIDHHLTTKEKYADYDNTHFIFDMDKCGATLAWEYFVNAPLPKLFKYVQDNDLYLHQFDETKYIHHVFNSFCKLDFDLVSVMIRRCDIDFNALITEGRVVVRYRKKLIDDLIRSCVRWETIGGHKIPTINTNFFFTSDVGHELCKLPKAPFAGIYSIDSRGNTKWSLRSDATGNNFDVAKIAESYGGGGHRNASAFVIKKENPAT